MVQCRLNVAQQGFNFWRNMGRLLATWPYFNRSATTCTYPTLRFLDLSHFQQSYLGGAAAEPAKEFYCLVFPFRLSVIRSNAN